MAQEERDLAPAVTRAIRILEALERAPHPLRLAELAGQLALPKSSVHGLCSSLLGGGLVERSEEGAYSLGLRLVDFANARLERNDLAREFIQQWRKHPALADETAVLSELDGAEVVYLACRNSVRPLGVTFRVGMRLPAAVTATGKAILSTLDDEAIDGVFGRKRTFEPLTSRSVKSVAALKRQLDLVRKNGYSIDDGETREGMCSFGAPVLSRGRSVAVAGVALSFFRAELDDRRARQAIATIQEVARALSHRAGSVGAKR